MNYREVNKDTVIDWQLERLQANDNSPMQQDMIDYLQQHPEIAAELETLKQFWQPREPLPAPSAKLKTGFYQSVAQLQESQLQESQLQQSQLQQSQLLQSQVNAGPVANDQYYKKGWFQAAAIALVFVLGLFTGRESTTGTSQQAIAALQGEVASLSTVMAISMLQKDSASERLAAVSYTRRADMADPVLLSSLVNSLAQEKSTAVKLAIIDAFNASDLLNDNEGMQYIEQSLLELALNEPQPMVQMALTQLLLEGASPDTKTQLIRQLQSLPLNQDVREFLQLIDAQNRI